MSRFVIAKRGRRSSLSRELRFASFDTTRSDVRAVKRCVSARYKDIYLYEHEFSFSINYITQDGEIYHLFCFFFFSVSWCGASLHVAITIIYDV